VVTETYHATGEKCEPVAVQYYAATGLANASRLQCNIMRQPDWLMRAGCRAFARRNRDRG
jgi:hypothetical protein